MNTIAVAAVLLVGVVSCQEMLGGLTDVNTDSAEIERVARFAVSVLGTEYALDEVINAQTQVINGLRTIITAKVIKSIDNSDLTLQCTFTVESQAWLGYEELVDFSCQEP